MNLKKKLRGFFTLTRKGNGGFTLVELIVVIAILAILAGIAVPVYSGYIRKAEQAADEQLLAAVNRAFTSACIDNGEYDMKNLSFTPEATLSDDGVTVNEYNTEFQQYFAESGVFKHYTKLTFNSAKGVFEGVTGESNNDSAKAFKQAWEGSSYNGKDEIVPTMLTTFDGIQFWFGGAAGNMEENAQLLLGNTSDVLDRVFGGKSSFAELDEAMNITDEQLDAYLAESNATYAAMNEAERAAWRVDPANAEAIRIVKGNVGVLYFAQGTAGKTADRMLENVSIYMDVLTAPATEYAGVQLSESVFREEYYKYLSPEAQAAFERELENKNGNFSEALGSTCSGLGGASFSYLQVAAMEKKAAELAAQGKANDAGISTLGSLYAVAAGYFNSDAYKNSPDYVEGYEPAYGDFSAVAAAMTSQGFWNYYGTAQSKADLDAYLKFMEYLSGSDNIDMGSGSAFGGQLDYINGAIGSGN